MISIIIRQQEINIFIKQRRTVVSCEIPQKINRQTPGLGKGADRYLI